MTVFIFDPQNIIFSKSICILGNFIRNLLNNFKLNFRKIPIIRGLRVLVTHSDVITCDLQNVQESKSHLARITLRTEITFNCEWASTQILIVNSHLYIESWFTQFTQFNFNSIFQFLYAGQMEAISWNGKYI